jgi:predicted RNase H-like nuclease (RuvC/YqgF family)
MAREKIIEDELISGDGLICDSCLDKRPKKSETELEQIRLNALKSKQIEQEKTKLNSLKSKLQHSTNPTEKEKLQTEIEETENHIKELENKNKSKNNSGQIDQLKEGYGKLFLIGGIVFSALIGLIIVIKIRGRRKKLVRK